MNLETQDAARAQSPMRLLRTKLFVPPPHPVRVERTDLSRRLVEGFACKLTLVSAPAGSGKTTLVSAGLQQSGFPVAWVSLDGRDNDPTRFWAYFVAGLQTLFPSMGESIFRMLQSPQPPPIEATLTELLNGIASVEEDFILVLDDYHVIETDAIHQGLTFLLENQPAQMHLVILTRRDPPLPLPLLQVRRELVKFGPADLRFDLPETEALFNQIMGMRLKPDQVAELERVTEGWVAGLQLAALSMQGVEDAAAFIRSFSGSHRYVFDYLAQEVLNRQPPHLKDFLLKTAVLERLCGPLCDQVMEVLESESGPASRGPDHGSGTSQALLEYLERSQLFIVPLDHERSWYRYHHLFREFLQAQLEHRDSVEEIRQLHRRASWWYESQHLTGEAVQHAFEAEDFKRAAGLIDNVAIEMFQHSELATLRGWFDRLPDESLREKPRLNAVFSWVLLATAQTGRVEELLKNIENSISVQADGSPESFRQPEEVRGILAEVACFRSSLAFSQMDLAKVVENSERARAYLASGEGQGLYTPATSILSVASFNLALAQEFSGQIQAAEENFREAVALSRLDNNLHLLPMAYSHLADLQVIQGQLHAAEATYREALEAAKGYERPSPLSGMAYTGLGNLLVEWDQLKQAEEFIQRGLALGRQWSHWEILFGGYFGLARIRLAQDRTAEAKAAVDELASLLEKFQAHWQTPEITAYEAWIQTRMGEIEPAAAWLQTSALDLAAGIFFMQEELAAMQARLLLALDRLDAAERLLDLLASGTQTGGRTGRYIQARALRSVVRFKAGRNRLAQEDLAAALALAEPQGYIRLFLDLHAPMQALLESLRPQAENENLQAYITRLLDGFSESLSPAAASEPERPGVGTGLLSERELEVLVLLAQGLTNQEIADHLYVSINTIKTHIKGIYNALDVRNRTEAASRAQELGLID